MSSIASSNSTSSQVNLPAPAFKVYRNYKEKSEDDWDGDVYPNQTLHAREIDGEPAPPYIIVVQGPPNVGKSLLIKSLVNYFTNLEEHNMDDIRSPITIKTVDKRRRPQFVECADDINAMVDAAKYADLVLLLVDASYGFEAETFQFVNLLQAHGFSNVMGVLTHLDEFKDETELKETKVRLQDHFWTEICQEATVSYLSGLEHDLYKRCEVQQLAKDILMPQFIPSSWRAVHPYVLVHIAGVGDFCLAGVRSITDPVPSSSEMEKESVLVEQNHMENESFRIGTYLRLEVHSVPFRLVENLDPCRPILVGGISPEEENVGHMQARLKRHKWHMKLLESADPVTVSAGWRRYQTQPIYASETGRHAVLDFSLEHEPYLAMFWGPVAPPHTRIAVVQSDKDVFRIVAKAVILDPKHHLQQQEQQQPSLDPKHHMKIMKDRKQKTEPHKILKRMNALIKFEGKPHKILKRRTARFKIEGIPHRIHKWRTGLLKFESDVAETKGLPSRTRSGIWGEVKKVKNRKEIATVPVNKDSPNEVDPAQGRLRLEQRRRVEISDVEPSSYPCSSYYMLFRSMVRASWLFQLLPIFVCPNSRGLSK
ncbi:hypothetical protein MKX03_009085 [Papaver bracteatum]|nr:hypothetical protein MKX03_009085 [Papaver bracteatum]